MKTGHIIARRTVSLILCAAMILSLAPFAVLAAPEWTISGQEVSGGFRFTVSRSAAGSSESVRFRTVSLSAVDGVHFNGNSGYLNFGPDDLDATVFIRESFPDSGVYSYQCSETRSYRLEITDMGGFGLASMDRVKTCGTAVPTSGLFGEKSAMIRESEFLNTDDGYVNNVCRSVGSTAFYTSSEQGYLQATGAQLRLRLSMDVKEKDDGYQYIQVLTDNTASCDDRSGCSDGDPGNISLSRYMAGFGHDPGDKNANYASYTFPILSKGSNCGKVENAWPGNSIQNTLYNQKFISGSRAGDGRIIVPADFSTLSVRFNASGNNDDDWYAKNVKAYIQATDATAPSAESVTVAPGSRARGNAFYVSFSFNEIVSSSAASLNSSWGTLNYESGNYSNVLTFKGYIGDSVTGYLSITGFNGAIFDLAGKNLPDRALDRTNICYPDDSYAFRILITDGLGNGVQLNSAHATYTYDTPDFTLVNPSLTGCRFDGWTGSNGSTPRTAVTVPKGSNGNRAYTANWTDFWGVADGADGSAAHPYVISDAQGLVWLQDQVNSGSGFAGVIFRLAGDIDMQGVAFSGIGSAAHPFRGTFDGDGGAVKNLTVTGSGTAAGLFGYIDGAVISGLVMDGASVSSDTFAGAVAGYNNGSAVTGCLVIDSAVGGSGEAGAVVGHGGCGSDCGVRSCAVKNAAVNNVCTVSALTGVTVSCDAFAPVYENVVYYPVGSTLTFGFTGQLPAGYREPTSYRVDNVSIGGVTCTAPSHDILSVTPELYPFVYTVVFDPNGGEGSMPSMSFTYGEPKALDPCGFAPPSGGYELEKWTTSPDGTGDSYADNQTVSDLCTVDNGVVTLYAKWRPIPCTGSGRSSSDPFVILYPSQLVAMAENVNTGAHFYQYEYLRLDADLDMSGIAFAGLGARVGDTIHTFRGFFDGNGHTISNLTIDNPGGFGALFAYIEGSYSGVKNLTVVNADVTAYEYGAVIAAYADKSKITGCAALDSFVTVTGQNIKAGVIVARGDETLFNALRGNYYIDCSVTSGSEIMTSDIGTVNGDCEGARGARKVTVLTQGVSVSGENVTAAGETYYLVGKEIALSGGIYGYTVNGENVYSSFIMPAEDVTVEANASLILTHVPGAAVTCEQPGNAEYWLGSDGNYYADENGQIPTTAEAVTVPPLGHDWEWVRITDPDCTRQGEDRRVCSRCGETESRAVEALGHDFGDGDECPRCHLTATSVTTWDELLSAAASGGLAKLACDVEKTNYSYLSISGDVSLVLDLNGHELNISGSYITIKNNGALVIRDSSPEKRGYITGASGDAPINLNTNFGGSPSLVLNGGSISGSSSTGNGGGVYMLGGAFTMNGGAISNNSANGSGGGVYVRGGVFTMNGGAISDNVANDGGGGVYLYENAAFVMNGGTISGNFAGSSGGGICVYKADFTPIGGSVINNVGGSGGGVHSNRSFTVGSGFMISGNHANNNGGGVYLESNAVLTSDGAEIIGNEATNYGGGVYTRQQAGVTLLDGPISQNSSERGGGVYFGSSGALNVFGGYVTENRARSFGGGIFCNPTRRISVKGTVNVSGNTKTDGVTANNAYLDTGALIQVAGDLSADSVIGVATNVVPADQAPVALTTGLNGRSADFLVDDTGNYNVWIESSGEAVLGVSAVYTLSVGNCEHGIISADKSEFRAGEIVELTISPDPGFGAQSVSYTAASGVVVPLDFAAGSSSCAFAMPRTDLTVNVVFVPLDELEYSITYVNAQDGINGVTDPNPVSYTRLQEIVLQAPVREGYLFGGWTYDGQSAPVTNVTIQAGSTGDRTFTAVWIPDWSILDAEPGATVPTDLRISDVRGLNLLSSLVNVEHYEFPRSRVELTADIVFPDGDESNFTAIGSEVYRFKGVFDGNGHTVSGIRIDNGSDAVNQGLFGCISGTVRNVVLSDALVVGKQNVGGIVGSNYGGLVENCAVTSSVVIRCVKIKFGSSRIGGIVGRGNGNVVDCRSSARIETTKSALNTASVIGGVIGSLYGSGEVGNCLAVGAEVVTDDAALNACTFLGAIAGSSSGVLYNNYYINSAVNGVNAGVGIGGRGMVDASRDEAGAAQALFIVDAGPGVILSKSPAYVENNENYYCYGDTIRLSDDGEEGYTSGVFVVTNSAGEDVTGDVVSDEALGRFLNVPAYDVSITTNRKKLMTSADVVLAAIPDGIYSGEALSPQIALTDGGVPMVQGVDYNVSTSALCVEPGTYTVTVSAAQDGGYYGSITASFTVAPRPVTIRAADQTVELNGSVATGVGAVTVSAGSLAPGHVLSAVTLTHGGTGVPTVSGAITPVAATIEDASGHDVTANYAVSFESGALTVTAPFTFGDLDSSGVVDTVDLTMMRQYLADATTVILAAAADVDCSGTVDTVDLTMIRQHLADATVILGPQN